MPRPFTLDDFGQSKPTSVAAAQGVALSEDARLAAYEEGYKAGWDDAVRAESDSHKRIGADLRKNLEDLSFTFTEARQHILTNLSPLMTLIAEKLLPDMAQQAFAQNVLDRVMAEAEAASGSPVALVLNPANRTAVEALLPSDASFPVQIQEDPQLGPGQAFLRGGQGETVIDIDAVQSALQSAFDAFLKTNTLEARDAG